MNTEKKLELAQLKNYLGTGLKCKIKNSFIGTITGFQESSQKTGGFELIHFDEINKTATISQFKPLMYRLSDLDKFIPELGFVPCEKLYPIDTDLEKDSGITSKDHLEMSLNYGINGFTWDNIQKLFEWHFWVFDQSYFEEGLIIDRLTNGT